MEKWFNRLLLFCNLSLLGVVGYYLATRGLKPQSTGWDYKDFVNTLLGSVAVLLAAVTVFVALVAIWGYTAIRESAERAAREVATNVAQAVATREAQNALALDGNKRSAGPSITKDALATELGAGDVGKE